jgi:undecaprenyl-phosphate 4-deoxy-4-formamido-L-arabinose transferase
MILSIVIPVYNSARILDDLINQILLHLDKNIELVADFEIVLINDNSRDESWQTIKEICKKQKKIKGINLSKNFGQHNALMAGIKDSIGDVIITMDDDMQHPPSYILKIINKLNEGYDVCYTKYQNNKYSLIKKVGSFINDKIANIILGKPKDIYLSSYKGIKKNIIDELKKFNGPHVYLDGIILSVTSNIGSINVEHNERAAGNSGYSFKKLFSLWLKVFTNSSIFPLRVASVTGFIITLISLLLAILLIILKINNPEIQQGWTSIATFIFFFSGVQLLALGIIGEYIGRIFISLNQKPQFIISEKTNNTKDE